MHNELIVLNDQFNLADSAFFREMDPDGPWFRKEFSMFLNNLGSFLVGKRKTDSAKASYLLSLEFFENEMALMALVLLFLEDTSKDRAREYALKYISLGEKNATTEFMKAVANFCRQKNARPRRGSAASPGTDLLTDPPGP